MCSSTRGPASVPSLVTWPTRTIGDAARLGGARELRRALAHLRHRARRRGELVGVHGLDRVDHRHRRLLGGDGWPGSSRAGSRPARAPASRQPEPARAQRDLRAAFLAGDVERLHAPRQRVERLQQQRRLADARVAADQHHAAFDDAAAEHAVELRRCRSACARCRSASISASVATGAALASDWKPGCACRRVASATVSQRVPGVAVRALAEPLRARAAAFGAGVDRLVACHCSHCAGFAARHLLRGRSFSRAGRVPVGIDS